MVYFSLQASISTPTNLARRRSITETKTFRLKEEKNHINYETQQSIMSRGEAKPKLNTAEVAIQVSGDNFYTFTWQCLTKICSAG